MPSFQAKPLLITPSDSPRNDLPAGLWVKCKGCEQMIFQNTLEEALFVCPHCDHHHPVSARQRIAMLSDKNSFQEHDADLVSVDALNFADDHSYARKIKETMAKTGLRDAVVCGNATLNNLPFALGVMDFRFFGASMGSVVGEKLTRLIEWATAARFPVVIVTASGGARMQEGALSLMQMAKTSGALMRHDDAGLSFIAILTNPTTGGVTASFASLGDVILAEPKALVGFAGPRVIKQTTSAELPKDFQSSEYLLKHGFIDRITHRHKLRAELASLLAIFSAKKHAAPQTHA